MTLIGLPTDNKSKTISLIAKSSFSWAMNCMILTKIFSGVSLGTTAFEPVQKKDKLIHEKLSNVEIFSNLPLGNKELTID